MGINLLLEPSALGEALPTPPCHQAFPLLSPYLEPLLPCCATDPPLFLNSVDIHPLQEAALQ